MLPRMRVDSVTDAGSHRRSIPLAESRRQRGHGRGLGSLGRATGTPVAVKQLRRQPGASTAEAELANKRAMREARLTADSILTPCRCLTWSSRTVSSG